MNTKKRLNLSNMNVYIIDRYYKEDGNLKYFSYISQYDSEFENDNILYLIHNEPFIGNIIVLNNEVIHTKSQFLNAFTFSLNSVLSSLKLQSSNETPAPQVHIKSCLCPMLLKFTTYITREYIERMIKANTYNIDTETYELVDPLEESK